MSVIDHGHIGFDEAISGIRRDRRREADNQALQQAVATVLSQLNFGRSLGQRQYEFNTELGYRQGRDSTIDQRYMENRGREDTARQSFSAAILPYLNQARHGDTGEMGPPAMGAPASPQPDQPDYSGLQNVPIEHQLNLIQFMQRERERVGGELHGQRSEATAAAIEAMAMAENNDPETATDLHAIASALRHGIYKDPGQAFDDAHAVRVNSRMARQGGARADETARHNQAMEGLGGRGMDLRSRIADLTYAQRGAGQAETARHNRATEAAQANKPNIWKNDREYNRRVQRAEDARAIYEDAQKSGDEDEIQRTREQWYEKRKERDAYEPGTPAAGATPTATAQDPLAVYTSIRQQHPEWTREQVIAEAKRLTGEP